MTGGAPYRPAALIAARALTLGRMALTPLFLVLLARAATEARAGGYDRVGVALDGGDTQWLSRGEFQALQLTERVRILATGSARFYRGAFEVSPMEAMRGMP